MMHGQKNIKLHIFNIVSMTELFAFTYL